MFYLPDCILAMKRHPRYVPALMAFSQATRPRMLAAFFLAAVVAFLGCWFKKDFVGASYDSLHTLSAGEQQAFADSRVVIVYLDLASYVHEHLDPGERWPRKLHAQLLKRLTQEHAKAVVFDIVFDTPGGDGEADKALADAMRSSQNTILAAEHNNKTSHETSSEQDWTRSTTLVLPNKLFLESSAAWGIASLWM